MATTRKLDDVELVALLDRLRSDPDDLGSTTTGERRLRWVARSLPGDPAVSAVSDPPGTWPPHLSRPEVTRLVAQGTDVWAREDTRPDGTSRLVAPHVLDPDDVAGSVDPAHVPLIARAARASEVLPTRLYAVRRGGGATRTLRRDLLAHLHDVQRSLVLEHVDDGRIVVRAAGEDGLEPVARWQPGGAPYAAFLARLLIGHAVEVIHLLHDDEVVADVAGLLGVPLVPAIRAGAPAAHPLTRANAERARYERASAGAEVPTLAVVTPGSPDRIAPTAHVRALRRAIAAAGRGGLRWERMVAADHARGLTGPPPDAILLVRNALPAGDSEGLLDRARADGTRVVLDLDDDLITEHAVRRLTAQGWDGEQLATLRRLVPQVDAVIVSTPPLAELVAGLNEHVVCRPNELDPRLWSLTVETVPPPDDDTVRVLYMGSRTHDEDLALLDGVTRELTARLGREVILEIVGVAAGADVPGVHRLMPARTDYPGFVTWLREQGPRWDVGVAPLVDTHFNRCKSDLKLLEYALLGLPSVASDVGPYAGSPLTRLTVNTTDAWVEAVAAAVEAGPEAAERAAAQVRRHRMLDDRTVGAWIDTVLGQPR